MWRVGSSPHLKRAHNPKVAGSNPAPATIENQGLADVPAANPFRLPRLHPGIGPPSASRPQYSAVATPLPPISVYDRRSVESEPSRDKAFVEVGKRGDADLSRSWSRKRKPRTWCLEEASKPIEERRIVGRYIPMYVPTLDRIDE